MFVIFIHYALTACRSFTRLRWFRTRVRVRNGTPHQILCVLVLVQFDWLRTVTVGRVRYIRRTVTELRQSHLIVERAGNIGAFAALINIEDLLFASPLSPDYFLREWGVKGDLGFQARAGRGMRKEKEEEEEKKKPQAPVNPPLLETWACTRYPVTCHSVSFPIEILSSWRVLLLFASIVEELSKSLIFLCLLVIYFVFIFHSTCFSCYGGRMCSVVLFLCYCYLISGPRTLLRSVWFSTNTRFLIQSRMAYEFMCGLVCTIGDLKEKCNLDSE